MTDTIYYFEPPNDSVPTDFGVRIMGSSEMQRVDIEPVNDPQYASYFGGTTGENGLVLYAADAAASAGFVLNVTAEAGGGSLHFEWAMDGHPDDKMIFTLDGVDQVRGTGHVTWVADVVAIPEGAHTLGFRYQRGAQAVSVSYSFAMFQEIDLYGFTIEAPPAEGDGGAPGGTLLYTFESGLISPDLVFSGSSDASNTKVGAPPSGVPAPPSGSKVLALLGNGENSSQRQIDTTATWTTAGTVEFDTFLSSEHGWDFGWVFIDDKKVWENSGTNETDWTHVSLYVAMGEHTVSFVYAKDDSDFDGLDAWFLDNIALTNVDTSRGVGEPASSGASYDRGKVARHQGVTYVSLVDDNATEPSDGASWVALGVLPGWTVPIRMADDPFPPGAGGLRGTADADGNVTFTIEAPTP